MYHTISYVVYHIMYRTISYISYRISYYIYHTISYIIPYHHIVYHTISYISYIIKYPIFLSDLNETSTFIDRYSKNNSHSTLRENPSSGSRIVPCGRTDGQKDMTKLVVVSRSFSNTPKSVPNAYYVIIVR
jgi:hypothetical protein